MTINTWRPSGHRVVDKLKRFFVGGGPELEDLSYIAQPSGFNVSIKCCNIPPSSSSSPASSSSPSSSSSEFVVSCIGYSFG